MTGANAISYFVEGIQERCSQHLDKVKQDPSNTFDNVDYDLMLIKHQLVPLMQEMCQLLTPSAKSSRFANTSLFLKKLLEADFVQKLLAILDWACQIMLIFDS